MFILRMKDTLWYHHFYLADNAGKLSTFEIMDIIV